MSLWRHFYECERTAEDLAGAMLAFHKKYDWDWMKVNPRASYHVEGWGVKTDYGAGGPLDKQGTVIAGQRDVFAAWSRIHTALNRTVPHKVNKIRQAGRRIRRAVR